MNRKQDIKKIIKRKIELTNDNKKIIISNTNVNSYLDKKIRKEKPKLVKIEEKIKKEISPSLIQTTDKKNDVKFKYLKKENVNYDVVICIPSHNRYDKLIRIIETFYNQKTKYSFKIIILNDGSTDLRYKKIKEIYNDIEYIENDTPNGKLYHWYCYNQLWNFLKKINCHAILQMDDDFILCDNFLNIIVDIFFNEKNKNNRIMVIAPHLWSFKLYSEKEVWWDKVDFVDGIALIDLDVIKYMNYGMKPVDKIVEKTGVPVRAWTQISKAVKINKWIIYHTENSLVYHDGNNDSKLHGDVRKNGNAGVYTQKYIGNL